MLGWVYPVPVDGDSLEKKKNPSMVVEFSVSTVWCSNAMFHFPSCVRSRVRTDLHDLSQEFLSSVMVSYPTPMVLSNPHRSLLASGIVS